MERALWAVISDFIMPSNDQQVCYLPNWMHRVMDTIQAGTHRLEGIMFLGDDI